MEGLDDGAEDELVVLLGGLDGVVLGALDVAELAVGLGALVGLDVDAGVVGTGEELVVGVGVVAEVCDVAVWVADRGCGVRLELVPTDAAGGVPGLWPPLRNTSTRAVASAAITATDRTPATSPAPSAPRLPSGGPPTPIRSCVRSPGSPIRAVGWSPVVGMTRVGPGAGMGRGGSTAVAGSTSGWGKTAIPS